MRSTFRRRSAGLGGSADCFGYQAHRYAEPVLVQQMGRNEIENRLPHGSSRYRGIDLVAMCVNDIVVSGRTAVLLGLLRGKACRPQESVLKGLPRVSPGRLRLDRRETAEMLFYAGRV